MLGEIGFETVDAAHGMEAIQRLRDGGQVDVMLVDCLCFGDDDFAKPGGGH